MSEKRSRPVIDFEPLERIPLRNEVGRTIVIEDIVVLNTRRGEMIIVRGYREMDNKYNEWFTFSKTVLRDVKRIQLLLAQGKAVRVYIRQDKKGALLFDRPPAPEKPKTVKKYPEEEERE